MSSPLFMRDVSLTLKLTSGTRKEFNCDVKTAIIESTPGDEVTTTTLCANGTFTELGKTTYALHLIANQDWTANGLANFLWTNEGQVAEFQYQAHGQTAIPPTATTPGMAGIVRLVAPNYGGEAENWAELDVTMPCQQRPTIVTAAFPTVMEAEAPAEAAA